MACNLWGSAALIRVVLQWVPNLLYDKSENYTFKIPVTSPWGNELRMINVTNKQSATKSSAYSLFYHPLICVQVERAGPWDPQGRVWQEIESQPCPPCQVPVKVSCLGGHEVVTVACAIARVSSCHRPCGRVLACCKHECELECHMIEGAADESQVGKEPHWGVPLVVTAWIKVLKPGQIECHLHFLERKFYWGLFLKFQETISPYWLR